MDARERAASCGHYQSFQVSFEACLSSGSDEKVIDAFVIGSLGQFCASKSQFEAVLQFDAPLVSFRKGHLASFDRQQSFPMLANFNDDTLVGQNLSPRNQQANQMHDVFPLHSTLVSQIGLHLLELGGNVPRVGLKYQLGQKRLSHAEQLFTEWRYQFHDRRVEAFEHIGIGFQRQQ